MGIFNLFDRFKASTSDRSPWGDFFFEPVSVRSVSGMRVSADSAMRLAAVYACVRILSETMDDYYNAFIKAVAKGRGVSIGDVRDGMGEGRVLGADAALASKMVDGIATFDDVLAKMQKSAVPQKPSGASRLGQARIALALV